MAFWITIRSLAAQLSEGKKDKGIKLIRKQSHKRSCICSSAGVSQTEREYSLHTVGLARVHGL